MTVRILKRSCMLTIRGGECSYSQFQNPPPPPPPHTHFVDIIIEAYSTDDTLKLVLELEVVRLSHGFTCALRKHTIICSSLFWLAKVSPVT